MTSLVWSTDPDPNPPSGTIACAPLRNGPYTTDPDVDGYLFGWYITSYFGGRRDPLTGRIGTHGGMDLAFPGCTGAEIIAPISGLLSQGWDSSGGGNWSGLTGHNGDYWGFGHASRFAFPGGGSRWVNAGDVIAYVGTTGGSTGPHLHIAYRPARAGSYRDPYDVLRNLQRGGSAAIIPPAPPVEPTPVTPSTPITIKELSTMGCIFNVDSGPQVTLNTATGKLDWVPGVGRNRLLVFTMNAQRHPFQGEADYLHLDWNDPKHQAACDDYYENWMPTLPASLQHDDRPRKPDGSIDRG